MTTSRLSYLVLNVLLASALLSSSAKAAFPNDFQGVVWIDAAEVANWPQTGSLTVSVDPRDVALRLRAENSKTGVWRNSLINNVLVNANLWVFARFNGVWHGATFEYMRPNSVAKNLDAVEGGHVKRPPFLTSSYTWQPRQGEVIAFMVSGIARFTLANNNVKERTNVFLYKWGVGPVTEIDDEGISDPPPPPPIEECVEPEPENNTHIYNGVVGGTVTVVTPTDEIWPFFVDEPLSVSVKDDRSLVMLVDEEQMQSQVNANGNFTGSFTLQEQLFGEACNVTINVLGNVNGNSITGSGTGSEQCGDLSAVLDATFTANSQTTPSFLDERPPQPKQCVPVMAPIHSLLLL